MRKEWPSPSQQARSVSEEAVSLARRARIAGLLVTAYMLELAGAEARKEGHLDQANDKSPSRPSGGS
jgi:hypothetical protein